MKHLTRYDVAVKMDNALRRYINTSEPDESLAHLSDIRRLLDTLDVLEAERDKVSDKEGDNAPYVEGKNSQE